MGEMYVLVQTWERCTYWFKHGRDVCIGSNMGEMCVMVQTWERCMYWFKHGRDVCIGSKVYRLLEYSLFDLVLNASLD